MSSLVRSFSAPESGASNPRNPIFAECCGRATGTGLPLLVGIENQPAEFSVADSEKHHEGVMLCSVCRKIFIDWAKLEPGPLYYSKKEPSWLPRDYHHKVRDLRVAKEGCYICAVVLDYLTSLGLVIEDNDDNELPVHCRLMLSPLHDEVTFFIGKGDILNFTLLDLQGTDNRRGLLSPGASSAAEVIEDFTWARFSRQKALCWFKDCTSSHNACVSYPVQQEMLWYPTRLLDLTNYVSEGSVKIIETKSTSPRGPFFTLSHHWGNSDVVKLTTANYRSFLSNVPSLPKTFKEAAEVTLFFGVSYLWIDSLCIIQDSDVDWQKEAASMGEVYQHGLCNIAAMASNGPHGGLFSNRSGRTLMPCEFILQNSPKRVDRRRRVKYRLVYSSMLHNDINMSLLNRRGWVMQERILSPRILHFGRRQLYWECAECTFCEEFPQWVPFPVTSGYFDMTLNTSKVKDHFTQWMKIVNLYSQCDLTFEADKLVAISGLAKNFAELFQLKVQDYVAGLWRPSLPCSLCWIVSNNNISGGPSSRPKTYLAPSWSWSAQHGPTYYATEALKPGRFNNIAEVLRVEISLKTEDLTGAVCNGYIHLRGPMHKVEFETSSVNSQVRKSCLFLNGEWITDSVYLDRHPASPNRIFAMPLIELKENVVSWIHSSIYLILLELSSVLHGQYTRLGMASVGCLDEEWERRRDQVKTIYYERDTHCESFHPEFGYTVSVI